MNPYQNLLDEVKEEPDADDIRWGLAINPRWVRHWDTLGTSNHFPKKENPR